MTDDNRIMQGGELNLSSLDVAVRDVNIKPPAQLKKSIDVPHGVDSVLKARHIDIGYNPDTLECRTSYGMPLKVEYRADGKHSQAELFKRKLTIGINELKGVKPVSIEKVAARLLHEKTHLDIAPIETPAAIGGLYFLYQSFDDPLKAVLATAAATFIYTIILREFIVEGLNYARYGMNILKTK